MTDTLGSVLVAEIGSLITRVTLVDQVDGESRMISHAETSSSVEPPYQNALYAVLAATAQISELTGRLLLREGQLIMPQGSDNDGINQLVVVTSAAGPMTLVITAIAADVSARSAIHASHATYTALLQAVTLDDAAGQQMVNASDLSWIERQVQSLLSLRPDAVLIAGGLEHGAVDAVNRLAHIVGLTAVSTTVDSSGQQRQDITARPVIYAGNSDARERVVEALSDRAEIFVVDNLRPSLDKEYLEPARQELSRLYEKQILPRLPGIAGLRRMSRAPIRTVCDVSGLVTRFVAEHAERHVLMIDSGASSSSAFYAAPGRFHPAVLGTCGVAYGLSNILAERGVAAIARWLPFPISDADLIHRLLNKQLRPHLLPASPEDLAIDLALAREAISMAIAALRDEIAPDDYDWLIACGGPLAHAPHPGMALLAILDATQPGANQGQPILDIHLDSLGLVPAMGALAALDPVTAVTIFDRDLRSNTPLATCVTPIGDGRPGEAALELELSVVGGKTTRHTVRHGELLRLPLSPGRYAQLTLRPAPDVRIGRAAPGEVVTSDPAGIAGSALGVVIDARGRPIQLPADSRERCLKIWEWLVALGAEHGASPYVEHRPAVSMPSAAPPEVAMPRPTTPPSEPREPAVVAADAPQAPPGKRISLSELAAQEKLKLPEEPPPAGLDLDLDSLRKTVEPPKRRGLFGRKK
ncbi:glutamate mutase L [Oscillochloris sp. ZM17-4]|uniref:glutamate mutase L n=1 Tax=Oscillochloris sp. ZM17-4 TaxID=2866714 RepID=UPI001C72EDA2|nr:glutamate mutase L [Oscillochloris sp. ZM17-4]MBX0327586.1 glutamate mutase L [Oscillochloris sp. ZM17-4]